MRNYIFCSVCLAFFGSICEVMAQPVAMDFSLPVRPASGYYNASPFLALYKNKLHMGEDWNGNKGGSTDYGKPVYPMAAGKVVKVLDPIQKGSVGKVVVIKHLLPDNQVVYSYYFHLSKILVKINELVFPAKPLGKIGDANSYYAGAAHLHFELRRVNQTMSSNYSPTLTIATVRKYLDPSLFIDDRATKVSVNLFANSLFVANDERVKLPGYAPGALTYVTSGGKTLSLFSAIGAGWIDPSIEVDGGPAKRWIWDFSGSLVFSPGGNFRIKPWRDCVLTIVVPGNHFQASRAREDMIRMAELAGLTRIRMETFIDLGTDLSAAYDLRSLCFDHGTGTVPVCFVHATNQENPLSRFTIGYEPIVDRYLGDWHAVEPNDLD